MMVLQHCGADLGRCSASKQLIAQYDSLRLQCFKNRLRNGGQDLTAVLPNLSCWGVSVGSLQCKVYPRTIIGNLLMWITSRYASMPFDNIKTRMQSVGSRHPSMLSCATNILRTDGVSAFWRGTSPRLVRLTVRPPKLYVTPKQLVLCYFLQLNRSIPQLSSGITFTVYDNVIHMLKFMNQADHIDMQRV
jgi:hypothetical protein